jgi:spore coat polysaccharide biosynthesis protein SpsF
MRNVVIIQARMSSKRLPGKVLLPLAGEPMLERLFSRLALCRNIAEVVLVTSEEPDDDRIRQFCDERKVCCIRGPLDDVAARFLKAGRELMIDAFVRINADSPFIDPALVDQAVTLFRANEAADIVTNAFPRSFPKGESVEVVRMSALERAYTQMILDQDKENVTSFFYTHPELFRIVNFNSGLDKGSEDLCVDTTEGLRQAQRIIQKMSRPFTSYGWQEVLMLKKMEE